MPNINNCFGFKATFFGFPLNLFQLWRGHSCVFGYSSSLKSSFCGVEVCRPQHNLVLFSHNVTRKGFIRLVFFGCKNSVDESVLSWARRYASYSNRSFDYCSFGDDSSAVVVHVSWIPNYAQNLHLFGFSCGWI